MTGKLHHVSVFIEDVQRGMHLFRDLLGYQLAWHQKKVGGAKLSAMLGIPELECEIFYLERQADDTAIELIRVIHPLLEKPGTCFGASGTVGLSLQVDDLDVLHQQLMDEGWMPFSPCMDMMTPTGGRLRAFCFSTDEGVTVELFQEMTDSRH